MEIDKMTKFEQFLTTEETEIKEYSKKVFVRNVFTVTPLVVIGLIAFKIIFPILYKMGTNVIIAAAIDGARMGLIISIVYTLVMVFLLRPTKYLNQIKAAVGLLNLSNDEVEALASDMLESSTTERKVDFVISHINAKNTPAKLICGERFAYLRGATPFATFVKIDDIKHIESTEEQIELVRRSSNSKITETKTLYLLYFYFKNRTDDDYDVADASFGFFEVGLRDNAYKMISEKMLK